MVFKQRFYKKKKKLNLRKENGFKIFDKGTHAYKYVKILILANIGMPVESLRTTSMQFTMRKNFPRSPFITWFGYIFLFNLSISE